MKIGEVREKIRKLNEEELRSLICEIYKVIPKSVREAKEIDQLFEAGQDKKEKSKKQENEADIDKLTAEISEFVEDAYDQLYLAPNRKITKKERPKWRFKVKNYIKTLMQIPPDSEDGRKAADLLAKLYKMTAHACSYYLFNTEDAFASVMIEQPAFYAMVVRQYLGGKYDHDTLRTLVDLLAPDGVSRENLYSDMYPILIRAVKAEEYPMLLDAAKEVQAAKLRECYGRQRFDDYMKKQAANHITEFISALYITMNDPDACAENLFKYDQESRKEVILYKLLFYYIDPNEDAEEWIRQYHKALDSGIPDRSDIHRRYEEVLKGL